MTAAPSLTVESLHIYPVKSLRAIDLRAAEVEPWGLAGDRRWLVVEAEDGRFITQRTDPSLARVTARYPAGDHGLAGGHGDLAVSAGGHPPLLVRPPAPGRGAEMLWVTVWRSKVSAAAAGPRPMPGSPATSAGPSGSRTWTTRPAARSTRSSAVPMTG